MDVDALNKKLTQVRLDILVREQWITDFETDINKLKSSIFRWLPKNKYRVKRLEEAILNFAKVREDLIEEEKKLLYELNTLKFDTLKEKIERTDSPVLPMPMITQALKNIDLVFPRPKGVETRHRIEWLEIPETSFENIVPIEGTMQSGPCIYILFPNPKGELCWFFATADSQDDDLFSMESLLTIRQKLIEGGHVHSNWAEIIKNYVEAQESCCSKP